MLVRGDDAEFAARPRPCLIAVAVEVAVGDDSSGGGHVDQTVPHHFDGYLLSHASPCRWDPRIAANSAVIRIVRQPQ
jgi:hypothetical protein